MDQALKPCSNLSNLVYHKEKEKKKTQHRQISFVFTIPSIYARWSLEVCFPAFDSEMQDAVVPFVGYC